MKNNKGFFLVEAIVIISLVTIVMAFVYPNISKLYQNYTNASTIYDQTEDIYVLLTYESLIKNDIYKKTCTKNDSDKCFIIENEENNTSINTIGCKKYENGNIDTASSEISISDGNTFGNIKKLYLTGYISDISSNDYNFNKYLKRLKKTTYDESAYRLIGIFEEDGKYRYASIKLDNPNNNRICNNSENEGETDE